LDPLCGWLYVHGDGHIAVIVVSYSFLLYNQIKILQLPNEKLHIFCLGFEKVFRLRKTGETLTVEIIR
jgi:hypothetical protein